MGYWGTLIAVRNDGRDPIALAKWSAELREDADAQRGDGWRVYSVPNNVISGDADVVVPQLVKESGAPVLAAYVADSDYGQLAGFSPVQGRWETWLAVKTAFEFERDHLIMTGSSKADANRQARRTIAVFGLPASEAAKWAVRWAGEAGYVVPVGPVRQILTTGRPPGVSAVLRLPWQRYAFAEDIFFALLDNLGVPRTAVA